MGRKKAKVAETIGGSTPDRKLNDFGDLLAQFDNGTTKLVSFSRR